MSEKIDMQELERLMCCDNECTLSIALSDPSLDEEVKEEIYFDCEHLFIKSSVGCVVVAMELGVNEFANIEGFLSMYKRWIQEDCKDSLTMMVHPLSLEGKLFVLYQNLLYVDGYNLPDSRRKMVLVFDNTHTGLFLTSEVDIKTIELEIDRELDAYERSIDEDIAEAERKRAEAEAEMNPYKNMVDNGLEHALTKKRMVDGEMEEVSIYKEEKDYKSANMRFDDDEEDFL